MPSRLRLCQFVFALLSPVAALASPWAFDPGTEITVDVSWRGGTAVVRFPPPTGSIDFDADRPETARATVVVDSAAATTGFAPADALLHGAGYLDSARFPQITFQLDRLVRLDATSARVEGRMTLRGETRPITFAAQVLRYGPDPDDPSRFEAGFDLTGSLDRTSFGSSAGVPDIGAVLPVHIRLLMSSR